MSKPMSPPRAKRLKSYLWRRLVVLQERFGVKAYRKRGSKASTPTVLTLPVDAEDKARLLRAYERYVRLILLLEDKLRRSSC